MHRSLTFLKKELLELLPPMVFFLVVFHFLSLIRVILEAQYHFTAMSAASATIAALVMLVAFYTLGTELVQALGPRRALDLFIHRRTANPG